MHYIQQYILDQLIMKEKQRFTDLRYPGVESNLFQYHLGHVIRQGYVTKLSQGGYTLTPKGLYFADRYSSALKAERPQPKIVIIPVMVRGDGKVLLVQKRRQPFVGRYHLPAGKVHPGEALQCAVEREVKEKVGVSASGFVYRASVHVTIRSGDDTISELYGFVMVASVQATIPDAVWWDSAGDLPLAPSVREIISIARGDEQGFYELEIEYAPAPTVE